MAIDFDKLRKLNPNKQVTVKVKDLLELAPAQPKPVRVKRKRKDEGKDDDRDD